ncbi:hypothetical protein [Aeoliella sp.]|uniref:hypothetical protein n=1 Tax=Aeoliella sp. TaxID=2795800 RepID=UPI003CCBF3D6
MTSSKTVNEPRAAVQRIASALCTAAWLANLALLVGVAWWIASDAASLRTLEAAWRSASSSRSSVLPQLPDSTSMQLLAAGVMGTGLMMLASVLVGPRSFRTVRSWLLLVAVIAMWTSLGIARGDLYWLGQQHRLASELPALNQLVDHLRTDWPEDETGTEVLGPYLAYPKPNPTTLLLATNAPLAGSKLTISAVERSPAGSICLELAQEESPAWIEWRPARDDPSSFISGLETRYEVDEFAEIAPHWFLVRYEVVR